MCVGKLVELMVSDTMERGDVVDIFVSSSEQLKLDSKANSIAC